MAIAGVAALLSLAGAGVQMFGQMKQADAAAEAEKMRRKQMNLEAARAKREQIRRSQVARAQATASAVTQGAQFTSALEGGKAQVANEAGRNMQAIEQDRRLGNNIFKANEDYAKAGKTIALGGGISSLGGAVSSMSGTLTRLSY
jgi:hypothetical protein